MSVQPQLDALPVTMQTEGGFSTYLRKIWAVSRKDLQAELRSKEIFGTMIAFSALAVIVFGMAFDLRVPDAEMVAPGAFWVVLLYSGVLGLNRSFGAEVDRGSLSALLLAPVDRSAIYFGKLLANLVYMIFTALVVLPIMLVIFDVNLMRTWIVVAMVLGAVGYMSVGTLFAALTASIRARETLLPVLLLPLMVPIFMSGVGLSAAVVDGDGFAEIWHWLAILAAYDLIFLTIAYLVFDLIWEDG